MASNLVQLIITARDQASSVFGKVSAALGGLGKHATTASGATGSLASEIAGGILQANLFGQAIAQVSNAVSFMTGKFEEAKQIQLTAVSTAGNFAALTGESFGESQKFVEAFNVEIAKIAGALPGATADYNRVANTIVDSVIPAFKNLDGSLNKEGLKQGLIDITKQMTLLGIQSGVDAGGVGLFSDRFLSGASLASLRQLEFGEKNAGFLKQIEAELKARNKSVDDLKSISEKERLEILNKVSAKFVSKEVIDAASNTVDGLLAGIQSSFFDPTSGLFGLLRDLSAESGQQNVMTAVASGIKATQAFFSAGAKILKLLGVPEIDPMLVLYNGIQALTGWINQISTYLERMAKFIGGGKDFGDRVNKIIQFLDIDKFFTNLANTTSKIFEQMGGLAGFANMGAKFGGIAANIVEQIAIFVVNLPWKQIAITAGNVLGAAGSFIAGFIGNFVYSLTVSLVEAVKPLLKSLWDGIVKAAIGSIDDLSGLVQSFFQGLIFGGIPGAIASQSGNITNVAISSIKGLGNLLDKFWESFVNAIKSAIEGMFNSIKDNIANTGLAIANPVGAFINTAKDTNQALSNPLLAPVKSNFEATANALINPIGALGGVVNQLGTVSNFLFGSNYKGNIPTAASGLLGAFNSEVRGMPSGANPVVANSSEFILSPQQMSRLMQGSATVGASQNKNVTLAPVFNIYGNDVDAIAQAVMQKLNAVFNEYQNELLA